MCSAFKITNFCVWKLCTNGVFCAICVKVLAVTSPQLKLHYRQEKPYLFSVTYKLLFKQCQLILWSLFGTLWRKVLCTNLLKGVIDHRKGNVCFWSLENIKTLYLKKLADASRAIYCMQWDGINETMGNVFSIIIGMLLFCDLTLLTHEFSQNSIVFV